MVVINIFVNDIVLELLYGGNINFYDYTHNLVDYKIIVCLTIKENSGKTLTYRLL